MTRLALLLLFSFALVATQPEIPYAIDLLTAFTPTLRCENSVSQTNSAPLNDPSFLGTRTTGCDRTMGTEVSTRAVVGSLQCDIASASLGLCTFDYMNIGGVDLLANGCGCWSIIERNPDRMHELRVTARSGVIESVSSVPSDAFTGRRDICIPIAQPLAVLQSVDSISLVIDGTSVSQLDAVIEQFCCTPRGDAYHSITPATGITAGECSTITMTIDNPATFPMTSHDAEWMFIHDAGRINSPTLACVGGAGSAFIQGNERGVFGTANLVAGASYSCTWEVCWDMPGSFDMSMEVRDTVVDNTYFSHGGGARFATEDHCAAPQPTTVTIELPPTTLPPTTTPPTTEPPTTSPPTTLPPTTLPPTTLPPTTSPPTTMPPTTEPPTTQPPTTMAPTTSPPTAPPPEMICVAPQVGPTGSCVCDPRFPCEVIDGTFPRTWNCDTSEWYCSFIRVNSPAEEYIVSYYDRMCSCFY